MCLKYLVRDPLSVLVLVYRIVLRARSMKIALKNLVMIPKGIYLAKTTFMGAVSHIHAHWASTTATLAYIVSQLTGIPWSFTAHRWDIDENNILKEKCRKASFVRVISERSREEINKIIQDESLSKKVLVIHMGVDICCSSNGEPLSTRQFTFICPANLNTVKGHRYLLEACRILSDKGLQFKCLMAGDGYLEDELKDVSKKMRLMDFRRLYGKTDT